jgi:hypothetical protein
MGPDHPRCDNTFILNPAAFLFPFDPDSLQNPSLSTAAGISPPCLKFHPLHASPPKMVMILYYGDGHWNSCIDALIYLRTRDLWRCRWSSRHPDPANRSRQSGAMS